MTRISGTGASSGRSLAATGMPRSGGTGAGGFVMPVSGGGTLGEPASAKADAAAPTQGLSAMLAVQETALAGVSVAQPRDRQARRRAQDLLSALAGLQRSLLGAGDAAMQHEALRALLQDMPVAADPALAAIVGAIALRAEVELARIGD